MSLAVTIATWAALHTLPDELSAIPVKRRPGFANCALVALRLADVHRESRRGVNDTVDQLAEALPLSTATIRACLSALDQLGWWVTETRGNQSRGSVRVPSGPLALRGANPTEQGNPHRGADPTEHSKVAPRGTPPRSAGYPTPLRGADPANPPTPLTPINSSSNGFNRAATNPLEAPGDTSELRAHRIARLIDPDPEDRLIIATRHALHATPTATDQAIAERLTP